MSGKLEQILNLVSEYVSEKQQNETWTPGEDWISYSGPVFDDSEYLAAVKQVLDGWMIFCKNAREFERRFPSKLGKLYGYSLTLALLQTCLWLQPPSLEDSRSA